MPISYNDLNSFSQVLSIWRPEGEKPIFILRWKLTEWCNYKCPDCPRGHDRFARKGKYTAHAFDNYPLDKWVNAFSHRFQERRLSLVITGGEPMLDRRNMVPLLKQLTSFNSIKQLSGFGYKIGMVNFVMDRDYWDIYKKIKQEVFELLYLCNQILR